MNLKNFVLKIARVINNNTIKLEGFDLNNILIDGNHTKIFWFMIFI